MMNNRRSLDPLIAVRAALEVGDVVGYFYNSLPQAQSAVESVEPIEAIAIVWDIHGWGVRVVVENERQLLEIDWQNLCPPF